MKFPALAMTLALAATPALAQDMNMVERSHVGPWRIMELRSAHGACSARIDGDAIDLIVMFNDANQVLLMAGHPTWKPMMGDLTTSLAFDGAKPQTVQAKGVMTTVATLLDDQQHGAAVKAKSIDWSLPSGRFTVNIEHLDEALQSLRDCQTRR